MASFKPKPPKKKPCAVCALIRKFLFVAAIVLAVMWVKPEWRLPPGYNYSAMLGDVFLAAFVLVFAYKWWEHKRDVKINGDTQEERFDKLRERTSKIVADLDDSDQGQARTTQVVDAAELGAATPSTAPEPSQAPSADKPQSHA